MSQYAWIDCGNGRSVYRNIEEKPVARSHLSAPIVIGDNLEVRSMVDGKMYTSKAALRRSYRERGYVEVGNEKQVPGERRRPDRKKVRHAVGAALSKAGITDARKTARGWEV